jgi:hypothetical protein
VQRKALASLIYVSAAAANTGLWLSSNVSNGTWTAALLYGLLLFGTPLLFVFAYSRFLFGPLVQQATRVRFAAILNGIGAATATSLFAILGSAFWKNPLRDVDSIALLVVPLVAVPTFLVAGISLLLKGRSTLAKFASFLFWPYWLLLALLFLGRFFQESTFRTAFCFLCFMAPVLFAFSAGASSYRPTLAHATAFAGLVGMPWIYWTTLKGSGFDNIWLMFNLPNYEARMYPSLYAQLTILSVALIVLAITVGGLRLIPVSWKFRGTPLCERTWHAFAVAFLFLATWFARSVTPYRIPGAVDYSDWPILQILHVEKHGLQFHETCINVPRRGVFHFAENHRRLLQYRFLEEHSAGQLPQPLMDRVKTAVHSPDYAGKKGDNVTPVHSWVADNWYFRVEDSGVLSYTSEKKTVPPLEITALFNDISATERSRQPQSDLRDVCLGFCYDPLAGLGFLFSNHRCFNDGHKVACR